MSPQLTLKELGLALALHGKHRPAIFILGRINSARSSRDIAPTGIDAVRRSLRGITHQQGRPETRGRKRILSIRAVKALNTTRKQLIKQANGEYEVHWKDVIKKARVMKVHRSTAKRALAKQGIEVEWRRPREKPMRTPEVEKERMEMCRKWRNLPEAYFTDRLDLIIDNKKFDVPTHDQARSYVRRLRVRGHLRTKKEGLQPNFTKPNSRKNRMNTGAFVNVCAGVSGGKVVLWSYLDKRWCGEAAAGLYRHSIQQALVRNRGAKKEYLVLEDNDPTGYKSKKACEAKSEIGIKTISLPRYSPDLNPLDFWLWSEVQRRMMKHNVKGRETAQAYKTRLRRTAMNLPEAAVRKAVASMKPRIQAVFDAQGGNITMD